jgi:ABC-type nitrate/sulfonate/bicarbonate transport system substrate-binding protein
VLQPAHGTLAVDVTIAEEGRTYHVGHEDLPEREAEQVRRVLRRALRASILTENDERLILDAGMSYERVITEALIRQLPSDPASANGIDLARLDRTLDLLAVEGHHVPYDAQTRYYRLMMEGRPAVRAALAPLAERFGFASEAFSAR